MPYAPIKLPQSGQLALDCPHINDTQLAITFGGPRTWIFNIQCGTDYQPSSNSAAGPPTRPQAAGSSLSTTHVDMMALMALSLRDCAAACASWNQNRNRDECVAVAFNADLDALQPGVAGSCVLKNGTGVEIQPSMVDATGGGTGLDVVNRIAGARLVPMRPSKSTSRRGWGKFSSAPWQA